MNVKMQQCGSLCQPDDILCALVLKKHTHISSDCHARISIEQPVSQRRYQPLLHHSDTSADQTFGLERTIINSQRSTLRDASQPASQFDERLLTSPDQVRIRGSEFAYCSIIHSVTEFLDRE